MTQTIESHKSETQASRRKKRIQIMRRLREKFGIAATILLPVIAISFFEWLFDLVFKSSRFPWRLTLEVMGSVSVIFVAVVFVSGLADSRIENSTKGAAYPVFRASALIAVFYGGGAVFCIFMLNGLRREGHSAFMQALTMATLLGIVYGWPRPIHFYSDSLAQRTRFGRMQRLKYSDVEYASYAWRERETLVVGKDVEIVHSFAHASKYLFHTLIEERTGKQVYGG